MRQRLARGEPVTPKYHVGQKVVIRPPKKSASSARDYDIGPYAGHRGKVVDYYWISPNWGQVFYIYTILIETGHKEVVLHEDELEAFMA